MHKEFLKGTALLLIVLSLFSLFSFKAPNGMKAMDALASAAVASFLVEAFQYYVGGDLLGIEFLGAVGASARVIVSLFGLVNDAAGTATPIAGLMVMYGFNDSITVTICFVLIAISGIACGYLCSYIFRNYKIHTAAEIRGTVEETVA